MDDILDSITKKGMKFKQLMKGKKNKPDKTGTNIAESINSSGSPLQPTSHIVTGGHGEEGIRTSTDERENPSRDRFPESVAVGEREVVVDEKEANEGHSRQDGRGAERVYLSLSSPSTPPTGEPKST